MRVASLTEKLSWMLLGASGALLIGVAFGQPVNPTIGTNSPMPALYLTTPLTVAQLPACTAGLDGARAFVVDQATAAAYRGAVTGSGAQHQAVLCASAAWIQD